MWTNYLLVSVDIGELFEACRAQSRIVELRSTKSGEECVDIDVLERLVDAANRDRPSSAVNTAVTEAGTDAEETARTDSNSQPSSSKLSDNVDDGPPLDESAPVNPYQGQGLLPRVCELLEQTILPRVSSPRIYRAYARLLTSQGRWDDALKAYMDAYRSSPAGSFVKGETDETKFHEAVDNIEEIIDILRNFGPRAETKGTRGKSGSVSKWLPQARSIVRTFMGRSKENFEDDPYWEKLTQLQDELRKEVEGD